MKHFHNKNKYGFTLAELLIVVAIIGVLVAISIPIFSSQLSKARVAVDQANVRSAKAAAAAEYMSDGETGAVSYLYDGGKAIKVNSSSSSVSISSSKGYGKSNQRDLDTVKNNFTAKNLDATGSVKGAAPKDGYVEVTVDGNSSSQITAKWVSSAGAEGLATGNYVFTNDINKKSITEQIEKMGIDPKDITTFKAGKGSKIEETVKPGNNRDETGDLVNSFQNLPNLKYIDLSDATLTSANINLFANISDSVQKITLPVCNGNYDIRGTWYYAGGQKLDSGISSSGAVAGDSRVYSKDSRQTIYRSQAEARAANAGA